MRDELRHTGLPQSLLRTGRLNRRTLLRTAAAIGVAGPFGVAARRTSATQDTGGAIIRSRPRADVMQDILAAYPLRREGAPEGGSVITSNLGDFDSVNPLVAGTTGAFDLIVLIYEGLVGVHPVDGSIIPGLADYELAADGVTYTFHIHPDARFHDGVPVTAADAAFTFDTLLDPTGFSFFASFEAILKSYRTVDDRTFEMVSNGPMASFLYEVVQPFPVMPKHVWENVAPADWPSDPGSTGEDPARVVGSGPYRFVKWVPDDHATLARNDDYWDRELGRVPYLDNIIFQIMPDSQARSLALDVGDIDMARMGAAELERFANHDEIEVVSFDDLGFTYYAGNLDPDKTSLFQDKVVRQALYIALDREAIIEFIFGGQGQAALGTQPPLSPAYAPDKFAPYPYDPARARELLAGAGWTDADGDGVVEKDGQRFSFTMLHRGDSSVRTNLAVYLQDAWAEIGVEMKVNGIDFGAMNDRIDAGDFEMVLLGVGGTIDPGQGGIFGTGANFIGYSNPEFDRLDAEQRRTLDPVRRIDLIVEQSQIVWDELPVGIVGFGGGNVGHTKRLHNFYPNTFGGLMWSAAFWYLEE